MQEKRWGNEYRTTMVCIDSCKNGVLTGRLYNAYIPQGGQFYSLLDMILRIEQLLDQMLFPQPYTAHRSFGRPPSLPESAPPGNEEHRGACATFGIRILFRQNASWQGSVKWIEGNREESFRSVLELLQLIHSALPQSEEGICL